MSRGCSRARWSPAIAGGVLVLVGVALLALSPGLARAQDAVSFVDELEDLALEPPLKPVEVQVVVMGDTQDDVVVSLEARDLATEEGDRLDLEIDPPVHTIVSAEPATLQVFTFTLKVPAEASAAKATYSGWLVARRNAESSAFKRLTVTTGPEETSTAAVVVSPEVVITAESWPWPCAKPFRFLCPRKFRDHLEEDDNEKRDGLEEDDSKERPNPEICQGANVVFQGQASDYLAAQGVLIDKAGRGQVRVQLRKPVVCRCVDSKTGKQVEGKPKKDAASGEYACEGPDNRVKCEFGAYCWCSLSNGEGKAASWDWKTESYDCSSRDCGNDEDCAQVEAVLMCKHGLLLSNWPFLPTGKSSVSGTFEGTLHFDATDKDEGPKVPVKLLLRAHWITALMVVIGGLAANGLLACFYGPVKALQAERERTKRLDALVTDATNYQKKIKKEMKEETIPDLLDEILATKDVTPDEERLADLEAHFQSFKGAYADYRHAWQQFQGAPEPEEEDACKDKYDSAKASLLAAKNLIWTADSDTAPKTMDTMEDAQTEARLRVTELWDCLKREAPVVTPFGTPAPADPERKRLVAWCKEVIRAFCERWKKRIKARPWYIHFGAVLGWLLRAGIVVGSGMYVTYLTKSTFGTWVDFLYAFLWGVTGSAVIKALASLLGQESTVLEALGLGGLLK
jgi:hypothetical protein